MKLTEVLRTDQPKRPAVVYGGRFQPFHRGHYSVYEWLKSKVNEPNDVWIATSNKTNFKPTAGDVSPFNFEEKHNIMTEMFGIAPSRIVQCKNPTFAPKEVLKKYHGYAPIYVAVVGSKDAERYKSATFEELKPSQLKNVSALDPAISYYLVAPQYKTISGTEVRDRLTAVLGDKVKFAAELRKLYGASDKPMISALLASRLKQVKK